MTLARVEVSKEDDETHEPSVEHINGKKLQEC